MRSFKKYGKENFKFEILEVCKPEFCLAYEQTYLDYYKPWVETGQGYNISHTATSPFGKKRSEYTCRLQSHIRKGIKRPIEFGIKISQIQKQQYKSGLRKPAKQKTKPIERIYIENGEVFEYFSINEIRSDNFDPSNVVKCCKNKQAFHKGYFWKYLSEN